MKIGIDCRTILNTKGGERAGVGRYTYELVRALLEQNTSDEYVLFFDDRFPDPEEFAGGKAKVVVIPESLRSGAPIWNSHIKVGRFFAQEKLDVLHAPAYTFPLCYRGKVVVTVHDLAIYKNPQWFPPAQWWSTKVVVPFSIRRAKKIIAVSTTTRDDILDVFTIPQSKVRTVYEGIRPPVVSPESRQNVRNVLQLNGPFLFCVCTIEPRKNIVRLIEAFEQLCETTTYPHRLVIAGAPGWKSDAIFARLQHTSMRQRISYIGYVSEADKYALMAEASAFVFPTLFEGFGLPVLEAMSVGTPVITSEMSATKEIGGDTCTFVDPYQTDEITAAMQRVLDNKRQAALQAEAARQRANEFTWQRTAQETRAVYQEAYEA